MDLDLSIPDSAKTPGDRQEGQKQTLALIFTGFMEF